MLQLTHLARKEGWDKPSEFLSRSITHPIVCLMVLAGSWGMGSIMGWMA